MSSRKDQKAKARAQRQAAEQIEQQRAARGRRMKLVGGVVAAAVVLVAVLVFAGSGGGGGGDGLERATETNELLAGVPQSGLVLGDEDAPLTLVEYADLKCPFCAEFSEMTIPALVDEYVKQGKLRIEFVPQTFVADEIAPGDSMAAATVAVAAGEQGRFWHFAEIFYANQKDETETYATDTFLREIGSAIDGLDVAKTMRDRDSGKVAATLEQASERFTRSGFAGTPSFELGPTGGDLDKLETDGLEPDGFRDAIDAALAEAEAEAAQ